MRAITAAVLAAFALLALACVAPAPASAQPWSPTYQSAWATASTSSTYGSTPAGSPRAYASAVALDNNGGILLTGGVSGYRSGTRAPSVDALVPVGSGAILYGDGLRSKDGGVTWQQMNSFATNSWYYSYNSIVFNPRALHASAPSRASAGDDRTLIYGGVSYSSSGSSFVDTVLADSWTVSSDCVVWNRINSVAAPGPRAGHALLSFPYDGPRVQPGAPLGQYYLLIGGASTFNTAVADVWLSSDGGNWWYRTHDSTNTFGARAGHGAAVINGLPYVMGGFSANGVGYDDVWRATSGGASAWVQVSSVWRGSPYAQAYGLTVTANVDRCVVSSGGGGAWVHAYDLTLAVGGERALNTPDLTGSIAVSTNTTVAPLSSSLWYNEVANYPYYFAPYGVAGVYTGGYFVAIGGTTGSTNGFTGQVKRLPRTAVATYLPSTPSTVSSCSAGSYGCGNLCTRCPSGTYSATSGATACTVCSTGKYQASMGATACVQCYAGTVADANGAVQCRTCPSGSAPNPYGTACWPNGSGGGGSSSGGLSKGAIAGIAVGGTVVLIALIACCCCCCRKNAGAAAAGGFVAAASPGSAAGLGMLSGAPAGAAVVVVYPGAAAAKSPRFVPAQMAYGGAGVDGRVVVVRASDANVSSWQSLF